MTNKRFKGIMPALITPFQEDGTLREAAARKVIDWQLSCGVAGFYICGATGEGPACSEQTRMHMAEATVDQVAGRGVVINHVGAADAYSSIRLAKHAEKIGCDAIASVPPTSFYGYGEDEIFDYYKALSDACGLPLMVYATAMFKQADITPFIERLMRLEHVIGLKFTRYNYYEMRKIVELNGGDINVINGPDEMLICGLTMGADGGIGSTYNVMPKQYVELYDRFVKGDFEGARAMQFRINHIVSILIRYNTRMSIKHILNLKGFDVGHAAFPGGRLTPEAEAGLARDLEAEGFFTDF